MEIMEGVHSIPVEAYAVFGMYAPNIYIVNGEQAVLIDSGYDDDELPGTIINYLNTVIKSKLSYILITHPHPDHVGGCQRIREITGAEVVIHYNSVNQAKRQGLRADILVEGGERFDIGGIEIEIIYTPGHTSGNICPYLKSKKILFTGDHVLGIGTTVIDITDGDMGNYVNSLYKLLQYNIKLICPGHGPLVKEPKRKIRELIDHRFEREKQIMSCLVQGKSAISDMVSEIYPELDNRLLSMATVQILAHLKKLAVEGRVNNTHGKYILL